MTTRNLDELRELIDHLLTQWALHSDVGTYRQPAARRGKSFTSPDNRTAETNADFHAPLGDYGSVSRTHQGNLSGDHLLLDGVSTAA